MMKNLPSFIILLITLLLPGRALSDADFYYELGGAKPFSSPPAFRPDIVIGGAFGLRTRFRCGQFDFDTSVGNLIGSARDRLRTQFAGLAQASLAALPALLLQRINPGLYDLFQNLMVRAEADVRVSLANCRNIEQALETNDPFSTLFKDAIEVEWQNKGEESGGTDITATNKEVEEDAGEAGIPWCDGHYRGGDGQEPIRPVNDTAIAGYAALVGFNDCTETQAPADQESRIAQAFSDGEQAAQWIAEVVGDHEIVLTDQGIRSSTTGTGLIAQAEQQEQFIESLLNTTVQSSVPFTGELRNQLSSPYINLDPQIIDELKNFEGAERDLIVGRLSGELALSRLIDQALIAKQLLRTGMGIPEIADSQAHQQYVNDALDKLDRYIEDVMFERRIRKELVTDTALTTLRRAQQIQSAVNAGGPPLNPNRRPLRSDGSVLLEESDQ